MRGRSRSARGGAPLPLSRLWSRWTLFFQLRKPASSGRAGHKYTLLQIAPIDYWQSVACTKRGTVDWDTCISTAIHANYKPGRFKAEMLRARGAWLDGKTKTEVGTETDRIPSCTSGTAWWSMARKSKSGNSTRPVSTNWGRASTSTCPSLRSRSRNPGQVLEIGKQFLWTSGLDADSFCGWIAVAPLCGILSWRPHIWLTGPSAAGKTEILNRFVKPLTPFRFESAFSGGSRRRVCAKASGAMLWPDLRRS